ncbi:hypothetical protein TNCV_2885221 [Trichonephila clavipes]|nr:hypothetical protein TNCV_2885221 [Trichonephila clavipes]
MWTVDERFRTDKEWGIPFTRDSAHKTCGPTDLTSTFSVCTLRVFGGTGIEPRPSGALTTRLPTAYCVVFTRVIGGRTDLSLFCVGSVTAVIRQYLSVIGPDAKFIDDNAKVHGTRAVNQYVEFETLLRTKGLACSPDLNPIEHVRDNLWRCISALRNPLQNLMT